MPAETFLDFDEVDLSRVVATKEDVLRILQQRGTFEMLDGVAFRDETANLVVGFKDVRRDAWWSADHVPGRPLFPGALMIESAAQLCTWDFTQRRSDLEDAFIGFAGLDRVRFRGTVEPDCRFWTAARIDRIRRTMFTYKVQSYVDRRLVFEAEIMGMVV